MLQRYTSDDGAVPCPDCGERCYVQIQAPILVTHEDGREAWVEGEVCYGACGHVWLPGSPPTWPEDR